MSYIIVNIWLILVILNVWAYFIRHLLCKLAKVLVNRMRPTLYATFLQVSKSIVNMIFYSLLRPVLYATFLQVSKSYVNIMFYSLFIPCLFCVNIFVSHSLIITSFKINDNFKSSTFLFSLSTSWICHKDSLRVYRMFDVSILDIKSTK